MISSILQEVLMPVSFGSLLCLMLLYWGQAALFSYTKYSKLTTVLFSFSFISLTTLLVLRWVDSGHFPLSNLYESLLFLSWSFLGIQLIAQLTLISSMPEPALLRSGESDLPHSAEMSLAQPTHILGPSETLLRKPKTELLPTLLRKVSKSYRNIVSAKFFEAKPDFALREVSQRQLLHLLGVITSPMALLTYGFAFLNLPREMQKATALVPALQSNWLMMHVTIMILSYAALLCGSIFSMVFLLLTNLNTPLPLLQTVSKPATFATQKFDGVPIRKTIIDRAGSRLVGLLTFAEQVKGKPRAQSEGYLKVEPQGPTGLELPKLCFSDGLELHDWVQQRVHTRPVQARRASSGDQLLGVALARHVQQATNKASFTHSGSTLSKQDLALLNSKTRFAGGAVTDVWAVTEAKQNLENAGRTEPADGSVRLKGLTTPYLSLAERLDNYSYRVLALGFPLLTVGILSGAVWANEAWGSYWSWDPKETWALITWLVFAIYLHARILKGWTGRKPAIIATFGFFVVWFCYLGVNLLGTGLHSYGWFSN